MVVRRERSELMPSIMMRICAVGHLLRVFFVLSILHLSQTLPDHPPPSSSSVTVQMLVTTLAQALQIMIIPDQLVSRSALPVSVSAVSVLIPISLDPMRARAVCRRRGCAVAGFDRGDLQPQLGPSR